MGSAHQGFYFCKLCKFTHKIIQSMADVRLKILTRKEVFYLTTHSTHLAMIIWRQTCGKGPFR